MCLAVPTLITATEGNMARVEVGGVEREISLIFTPEAKVGDYVLIHTGYAIGTLSQEEAEETLRLLREMELAAESEADPAESREQEESRQ
jgi:hydrogenase expression/formation protein HypC